MRHSLPTLTLLVALLPGLVIATGCSKDRERHSRLAAKRLVAAPKSKLPAEMKRVVKLGAYVLPDIEQEIHGVSASERRRLVEAMRRIGSAESLHLLDYLGRWDTDDLVKKRAKQAAAAIRRALPEPAGKKRK